MGLWIINQDETIMIKVDRVDVRGTLIYGYGNTTTLDGQILGKYDTESRAKNILRDIGRHLIVINEDSSAFYVYEMPEE